MKPLPIHVAVLALGLTSCAGKKAIRPELDLIIEQRCLLAPIVIAHHQAKITYRKGCERISVQGGRP